MQSFDIARLPRIVFGAGARSRLPALAAQYGRRALLVTGARSFRNTDRWPELTDGLLQAGLDWQALTVDDEPSPQRVDDAVRQFHDAKQLIAQSRKRSTHQASHVFEPALAPDPAMPE